MNCVRLDCSLAVCGWRGALPLDLYGALVRLVQIAKLHGWAGKMKLTDVEKILTVAGVDAAVLGRLAELSQGNVVLADGHIQIADWPSYQEDPTSPARQAEHRGKVVRVTEGTVTLPTVLNTPEFRAEWAQWVAYRKGIRRSLTRIGAERQLARLAKTPTSAVSMLNQTMEQGWTGIFDLHAGNGRRLRPADTTAPGPEPKIRPDAPTVAALGFGRLAKPEREAWIERVRRDNPDAPAATMVSLAVAAWSAKCTMRGRSQNDTD